MSKFILLLSGFKKDVIDNCKMDKFHAIAIGCIMLFVGIYATLAWYLFFSTAFNIGWEAFPMGLLFGYFIVCFDRALIASMALKTDMSGKKWLQRNYGIIFRFTLAIVLGIFLSQPVILKIYQPEVHRKAELLIGEENTKKQEELDNKYKTRIDNFQKEINNCDTLIKTAKQDYNNKTKIFQDEYKGTGGSGKSGYDVRAKKDEGIMNEAKIEYENIYKANNPKIQQYKDSINVLEQEKKKEYEKFVTDNKNTGLIMQEKALMKLLQEDDTRTFFGIKSLWFRYFLLSLILTLIELSTLIAKLFFPFKSYQNEVTCIIDTEEINSGNKKEMFKENLDTIKTKLKLSFSKHIASFFAKTEPIIEKKLDAMIKDWEQGTEKDKPLTEFCQSFMDKLLIQVININQITGNNKSEIITDVFVDIFAFASILVVLTLIFIIIISYSLHIDNGVLTIIGTSIDIILCVYKFIADYNEKKQLKNKKNGTEKE